MSSNAKGLVLIFEERGAKEFADSVSKTETQLLIICGSEEIRKMLSRSGYSSKTIADYQDSDAELKNARNWMSTWPDRPILNGKSFKELLVYQGISIYWFLQTRFYLHRIRDLIVLTDRISKIISIEAPERIWVKGSQDVRRIVESLRGQSTVAKFEQLEVDDTDSRIRYKSYQGHPMLKLLLLKILRGTLASPGRVHLKRSKGKILVVTEVSNWRRQYAYDHDAYEMKDVFFHDITRNLTGLGYDVSVVDYENNPSRLLKARSINKSRQKSFGVSVRPWEKYITFEIIRKSRSASRRFAELWNQLRLSPEFTSSLAYRGVSIDPIKDDVEDLLKSLKAHAAVAFIEAAKKILEDEKPDVVLMHDEYGALQLSLINAARDKDVPTISIQHGIISEEQISYVHEPAHITGDRGELLFPVPDRMCVWSDIARQNLVRISNFPESVPVVTGDPKVDFLPDAIGRFERKKILSRLGIPEENKVVLFATENLPSPEEKMLITSSAFKALAAFPECHVLIKMHPNEADSGYYENSARKLGLKQYSIIRDANLYEALYVSDLVILSYSTVAVEAMRMEKPVMSLDLLGLHRNTPFIKGRMAIVIDNPSNLQPEIRECLSMTPRVTKMIVEAKAFADQELGAADGMASQRIVKIVEKLLQDRQAGKLELGAEKAT